jgi:hypothetical protein
MCVGVCVSMCLCACVYVCTRVYMRAYVSVFVRMCVCAYCMRAYAYMCVRERRNILVLSTNYSK